MRQIGTQSSKYFRRVVTMFVVFAMVITSLAVSSTESLAAKKVSKVKIGVKVGGSGILVLKKGQSKKLNVSVTPKKASKKVSYKSSNKKVVKVSSKGVVKALKSKGSAKITVTSKQNKKKKATIKVKIGTPIKKVSIKSSAKTEWTSANWEIKIVNGQKKKIWPKFSETIKATKGVFKVQAGRTVTLTTSVSPKKATSKKVNWTSSKKSLVSFVETGKSNSIKVVTKKEGTTTIKATAMDGSGKSAKVKFIIGEFQSDKTPAPTAPPDDRIVTMIDNFENYNVGTVWDKYTAAGKANSGHMTVVTDPEDANNKCLEIKYDGADLAYDFAPVFNVDLSKLKDSLGVSADGKTLGSYTGVRLDARVVGNAGDVTYKKIYCYFDQYEKIAKSDKFAADGNKTNSAHVNNEGKAVAAGDATEDKSLRFGVEIPMAEGDEKEGGITLFNGASSKESNKFFPFYYDTWKPEDSNTHYKENSCTAGYKSAEADGKVGFAKRVLTFNTDRINEADSTLLNQSKFDVVIGSTYEGYANYQKIPGTSVTLYIDNVGLVADTIPVTGLELTTEGEARVAPGSELQITPKFTPENTTQKGLNWTVNHDKVTVDNGGKVKVAEDFAFAEGETEKKIVVTATSKDNPKITKSIEVVVYYIAPESQAYVLDLAAMYDTETKFTQADGTELSIQEDVAVEQVKDAEGKDCWKLKFTGNNQRAFFKLPESIDLSVYGKLEVVGFVPGQISLNVWSEGFDKTADSWWEGASMVADTYPFFGGSRLARPAKDMTVEEFAAIYPDIDTSKVAVDGKIPKGTAVGPNAVETFTVDLLDIKEGDWSKSKYISIGSQGVPEFVDEFQEGNYLIYSVKLLPKEQATGTETETVETGATETVTP